MSDTICVIPPPPPFPPTPPPPTVIKETGSLSHFMEVKASYGLGLTSAQAWGCPCSIKSLFKDIKSALTSSLPLFRTLPFPICCLGN